MTDSPFFARSIRCRTLLRRLRRMRSLIPTAANCRDSQQTSCAPEASRPRCSAYRPTPAIARATSSGQSEAIAVRPASFRPCRHAKLSGLPDKTEISLTPRRQAPGSAAERAHAPIASQPAPYALPSRSQKTWLALARLRRETSPADPANGCWLCGGVGMREQPTLRFSLRCEAGCRLCFRDGTQHTLSVWSFLPP